MAKQVATTNVTTKSIMRTAAFMRGVRETRNGIPMDYDAFDGDDWGRWNYERGRQFGILYAGPVKDGNKLTLGAMLAMREAVVSKTLR